MNYDYEKKAVSQFVKTAFVMKNPGDATEKVYSVK